MENAVTCPLAVALGEHLRANRETLTRRWLDRICARVSIDPNRVFPTEELLDHVPVLMDGIADYMEDPADEIGADMPVVAKAMELGELRHSQGFDVHEILKEYEILGGVLFNFLVESVDEIEGECSRGELLACAKRVFRAISAIEQVTTAHYLRIVHDDVRDREERLRSFNRMVTHELKNGIGAINGASGMLQEEWVVEDPQQRQRFLAIIDRNSKRMQEVLEDLLALSRSDESTRKQRHVLLPEAVAEAMRQLREMAQEQGVELRVAAELPPIEVNAAALELCLTNYISNGIKYSDESRERRWVEVRAHHATRGEGDGLPEVVVEVRDNGIGVPVEAREHLFERFFRASTVGDREGTGLGLSIVRETAERVGGRAWAEFDDDAEGAIFKIALPARRSADASGREPMG